MWPPLACLLAAIAVHGTPLPTEALSPHNLRVDRRAHTASLVLGVSQSPVLSWQLRANRSTSDAATRTRAQAQAAYEVVVSAGRSPNSPDAWEVWVPAIGRKVRSSSLLLDEEYFPWLGKNAYQPLKPTAAATHAPVAGLNVPAKESNTDTAPAPDKGANDVPNR